MRRLTETIKGNLTLAGVTSEHNERRHPVKLRHQLLVALSILPGRKQPHRPGMHWHYLKTNAVVPLQVSKVG